MVRSGAAVTVSWTTHNIGEDPVDADFGERVIIRNLDSDEIIAQTVVPYSVAASGSLASGASAARQVTLTLPEGEAGAGHLQVTVTSDVSNTIAENSLDGTAESNNVTSLAFESALAVYPDLAIRDLAVDPPDGWAAGGAVTVTWKSVNIGQGDTEGGWTERLVVRNLSLNQVIYTQDVTVAAVDGLAAGAEAERSLAFVWPTGRTTTGTIRFDVETDFRNEVLEVDPGHDAEANNLARSDIPSAPDLVVDNLSVATSVVRAGGPLTVTWDDVNNGAAATPESWYDRITIARVDDGTVLVDQEVFHDHADGALAAGASLSRSFTTSLPNGDIAAGDLRITVVADRRLNGQSNLIEASATTSSAEYNNTTQITLTSEEGHYADLNISNVTVPAIGHGGDAPLLGWTVTNDGSVATEASAWVDRVILSRNDIYGDGDDVVVADVAHSGALAVGDSYTVSQEVTLPIGYEGALNLFIVTDADAAVLEPDTRGDNVSDPAAIALTSPFADLGVEAVFGPATAVSGDTVAVSWRVRNTADGPATGSWVDRVLLSADGVADASDIVVAEFTHTGTLAKDGSYSAIENVALPEGVSGVYNLLVVTDAEDSVYERDLTANNTGVSVAPVTISAGHAADLQVSDVQTPDGGWQGQTITVTYTVENTGDGAARAPWRDRIYLSPDGTTSGATLLDTVIRSVDLAANGTYTVTRTVTLPDRDDGDFSILVIADAQGQVYEGGLDANNGGTSAVLRLRHPNLAVSGVSAPDFVPQSGATIAVSWRVDNDGEGTAAGPWLDEVWLSRDDAIGSDDVLLGSLQHTGDLASGAGYDAGLDVALPIGASGAYRILVRTDAGGALIERADESDNIDGDDLAVSLSPYADLVASDVAAPTLTVDDPARVTVSWTVTNQGTGAGVTADWTDAVIASADDILGNGDDVVLATFDHTGGLDAGDSYERSEEILLPPGFRGRYSLFVLPDSGDQVFENGFEANNAARFAEPFDVTPITFADLTVDGIAVASGAESGKDVAISWTVKNQGIGLTSTAQWNDHVYLSASPDGSSPLLLGTFTHLGFLAAGDDYTRTANIHLPDGISGTYYLVVATSGSDNPTASSSPYEFVFTGNDATVSDPFTVGLSPAPDLKVISLVVPATAEEGSTIDVTWTVQNAGAAAAAGTWVDRVFMRLKGDTGRGTEIGTYSYTGPLGAGHSYTRQELVTVPEHNTNLYDFYVVTDYNNAVYEYDKEDNNTSTALAETTVQALPRPDLQVSSITAPDTMDAGGTASVSFTVINQGPVATTVPNWTDQVYLSLDDKITSDDVLIGSYVNGAALATGEEYQINTSVFRVPDRFRGTVYVIVKADAGNAVDEWPNEGNNVQLHEIYVNPLPFADLVVSDVATPAQAFETNAVTVHYTVTNLGAGATNIGTWAEQIWLTTDKNRPHPGQGDILLQTLQYDGGILAKDAGYDRVVDVTLPDHIVSGRYYITPWVDPYATVLEDTLDVNVNPDDPNEVNNNNYKAGGGDIIGSLQVIGTPAETLTRDVKVSAVVAPASASAGDTFTVSWTVTNTGESTVSGWSDRVTLSDRPGVDDGTANKFQLGSFAAMKELRPGESYTNTQTVTLNPAAQGLYVTVQAVLPNDVTPLDNAGVTATSVTRERSDLRVVSVVPDAEASSGEATTVTYTVQNVGAAVWSGTTYWRDEVWISKDPSFIANRAQRVATVQIANPGLGTGDSYSRTVGFTLPPGIEGDWYVYVVTNVYSDQGSPLTTYAPDNGDNGGLDGTFSRYVYEDDEGKIAQATLPVVYREPDLKVTDLQVPGDLAAGSIAEISFTVTNIGNRATREDQWKDLIYLSADASLDTGDYLLRVDGTTQAEVASYLRQGVLEAGDSYTATVDIFVPFDIVGDFHILAVTDSSVTSSGGSGSTISPRLTGVGGDSKGVVREFLGEGNNTTGAAVAIAPLTSPDLQVTALSVPERAVRGQPFDISYTVTNEGGATVESQSTWNDLIYISRDDFLDLSADRFLGSVQHTGGLGAGASYTIDRTLTVPNDLSLDIAAYHLFVVTDPVRTGTTGSVYEGGLEDNNEAVSGDLIVELPDPTNLDVQSISVPLQANAGEALHVEWTVANLSPDVAASGSWTDSVFLSSDATWDINDRPLGRATFSGTLAPDDSGTPHSYTLSLDTTMPGVTPGDYRIIVRTDIFNQVNETDDAVSLSNAKASGDAISLGVDTLQIGVPLTVDLAPGQERLYQINVAADETLRVKLTSDNDSSVNEIFLRHDVVPTSALYDATYQGQLSSDLTALIPSTEPGKYYLLVRGFAGSQTTSNVTLLAQLLPLVITEVHTDVGGDGQYVTTTITGAQFHDQAVVKLVRPDIAEYEPVNWQVINSSKIIATFDLTGAPHGLYDLSVTNPSGDQAVVPYRFLVERAIEPDVSIGLGGDRVILAGDQATYSVALQGISNLDAPYTFFQVGIPELQINPIVYGLPYVDFYTNVRGAPEGAAGTANADVPWAQLDSITNTNGQLLTSGFLFDQPADGFDGFTFNVTTYPGLKELADSAFDQFRSQMSAYFPDQDQYLQGGAGGIGDWWAAVKDQVGQTSPGLAAAMNSARFRRPLPGQHGGAGRRHRAVHPVPFPHPGRRHDDDARRVRRLPDRAGGLAARRDPGQ